MLARLGDVESMYFLIYISTAVELFSTDELIDLLVKCRENNERTAITGMLLYKDGNFMQLLEGPEDAVVAAHARIAKDRRHRGLITMLQGPQEGRQFPDWGMGFQDLRRAQALQVPGYSRFLETPLSGEAFATRPTECQRLLLMFKKAR